MEGCIATVFFLWVTASLITAKCDAVIRGVEISRQDLLINLFLWPICAVVILCEKSEDD